MPEGPELKLSSLYVNATCKGKTFRGKVVKSAVSKCCEIDFCSPRYTISSEARGKEMALRLNCMENPENTLRILFRFGMSGRFWFGSASDIQKHAHLNFFTVDEPSNVLSFVDPRRFGSWHVMQGWGPERGPDPMYEYGNFRANVLAHLDDSAFNRPICEALLNQKYFNGVGNYLRAEILFRIGVPPFTRARDVLETLKQENQEEGKEKYSDLLELCHSVPLEVIDLSVGVTSVPVVEDDYKPFVKWLRCYENPNMNRLSDHNRRTIWYKGEAGPLAPKIKSVQKIRKSKSAGVKRKSSLGEEDTLGGGAGDQLPSFKVQTTEDQLPSFKGQIAENQLPSFKGQITEDQLPSFKGQITEDQLPSSKGQITEDQLPSSKFQTTEDQLPSSKGWTTGDQLPSSKGWTTGDQLPSSKGQTTEDQLPSFKFQITAAPSNWTIREEQCNHMEESVSASLRRSQRVHQMLMKRVHVDEATATAKIRKCLQTNKHAN